ncbi:MAG: hypothetical protein J6O04_10930 [Selenomonadaceae bacterium]|nr:hypothetical protein [Selenomonadaceae bacterium]
MDVTPMSLQMVVPHSTEVGQIQHNMNQAGALQQSFETLEQKRDAELKQQQVREKDNLEDGKVKDDPERQNRGSYRGMRRRAAAKAEEEVEEEKFAVDPSRGRHLDISF